MPTPSHVEAARYVGRYLKATSDLGIEFSSRKSKSLTAFLHFPLNDNEPVGLADAGWGPQDASIPTTRATKRQVPIKETRSICGHIIFMCGGPVLWKSHKERRNSRSSAESEVKTTDECTKSVQWLRNVLDDLNLLPSGPTTIYNDNMAAVQWSNSTSTKGMRHVNIRENAVRKESWHTRWRARRKELVLHHDSIAIQSILESLERLVGDCVQPTGCEYCAQYLVYTSCYIG